MKFFLRAGFNLCTASNKSIAAIWARRIAVELQKKYLALVPARHFAIEHL
jgi:hypothetical protein